MMSRGYGAMLFKKSAAGLDHLKQNVSKFLKQPFVILLETLPQVQVPAGKPSLTGARRTGARDRGHGVAKQLPRTCDAPRTRTYSHLLPRPRSCAPHHVSGGATGGRVCRTSRCQCRRRLEVCDGRHHRLHVLWRARSCSIRALLTQPRCGSGTAPHCFGRQGVSSVFRE